MLTPIGTEVYLIDDAPVPLGCVTSIDGISETTRMRDRTALTSHRKTEVPADTEPSDLTLTLNVGRFSDAVGHLHLLRGLEPHRFAIALGKGEPLTMFSGNPEAIGRNVISGDAFITSWALGSIEAETALIYTLTLKPLDKLALDALVQWQPTTLWQGGYNWR